MAKKIREQVKRERSQSKTGQNHEILGMLMAGVSGRQISRECNLSYSGAKRLCAKLKSSGSCGALLVLGVNVKRLREVLVLSLNVQK